MKPPVSGGPNRSHLSFVFLRAPYYHAQKFLFFLRKFGSLAGLLRKNQNFRVPIFCWREKAEISRPWVWTQPGISGSTRTIYFLFFSVPQCLRGAKVFVFGCGLVAPCLRGCKGLVFWLRPRRAVFTSCPLWSMELRGKNKNSTVGFSRSPHKIKF